MVAPYLADQTSDMTYPVDSLALPTLRVVDHDIAEGASPVLDKLSMLPSEEMTAEVDGATEWLGVAADEILLAALARAISRTIGDGVVAVDVTGDRRWLLHAIPLLCASAQQAGPTELLGHVHRMLDAAPARPPSWPSDLFLNQSAEVFLNYIGTMPDGTTPMYETPPGLGYALELRVYRTEGLLHLDWWYDSNRFDRYTIEELTEQFPLALFEMTSDAAAPV
jgi:hypothetical protein